MSTKKNKKNFKIKGIFVLIIFFMSLFLLSLAKETYRNYKVNKEIKDLKAEITLLRNENSELDVLINYLKTEKFAEREARLKLGMQKSNEKVFIIDNQDKDNGLNNNTSGKQEISNVKKWWLYFFSSI